MLSDYNFEKIGFLLAKMNQYSLNRPYLYEVILSELASVCEIRGPCSLMRYTTSGQLIGKPSHINLSHMENLGHKLLWYKYIKGGNNPIVNALLLRHQKLELSVDFVNGMKLLKSINYYEDYSFKNVLFNQLAKNANVEGLGYLWLKLSTEYVWIFCLRRRTNEGCFSKCQEFLLKQYGHTFLGNKASWYIPFFDILDLSSNKIFKDKLTKRQFETLFYLGNHHSRKECAKLMSVSTATIDRNIENILEVFRNGFDEFKGNSVSQIIRKLKASAYKQWCL